jgi:sulfoxide reductase catalytic subunit YedY
MAVPWLGIPLAALVRVARPLAAARFVRFVSAPRGNAAQADGSPHGYPWPYTEGLTLEEATNDLAFLATGIFGHDLPVQHGAPLRLVVPWQYAYKSIKAVVRVEFTAREPATFWVTRAPHEYMFRAVVDPETTHPRWPQHTERMLGSGEIRSTLPFNGYAEWVAHMYA